MAMSIAETTKTDFFSIMQRTAVEVLTLATYAIDKVEVIKVQHGSKNPSGK